jgi:hypothetical protein
MTFTKAELEVLKELLVEESMRMDDDGRDGAFDASPLKPIYDKIRKSLGAQL